MKTALVTGGNRGIGEAIVSGLASQGYHVLLGCRSLAAGQKRALATLGSVTAVELELGDPVQLAGHIDQLPSQHPRIDVLVNNAGVLNQGGIMEVDLATLQAAMQVNFWSAFQLAQAILPGMLSRNYGRIVNVSSGWGSFHEGLAGPAAYSLSKAALNALTAIMSHDIGQNIKINATCPGWVRPRMGGDQAERSPQQGAETALWLATLPPEGPSGGLFRDKQLIAW
ncbi:SDR family NAD(P)-dependent oxidoreductase [Aliagarivorans taiwanensis]|uniref:SDR family NAD(P)-dependent oxidoreductase n=1 Tax=Aliagarivorans taiwanensis TaxID=561966 RepID=UPI0003FAD268|nr:SDR family NAD(P)-dependent oxidoreductase [Aliagarivorans taiwanensis]